MLNNKKRIFLSPPHIGKFELEFVKDAFSSNYVAPLGPQVDAFEKAFAEYTGIDNCLALNSGTAAMHLSLKNIGVDPGDEVFASTLTFIGSVTPITFLGAKPVFLDSDRTSWNMNPDLLEASLKTAEKKERLPKAVVPTDIYGQCANYHRIFNVCKQYDVPVIIDAAEAVGSWHRGGEYPEGSKTKGQWTHAGKGADSAIFSFNGNKIITTSGGGILASDDKGFIEQSRFLSQQARDPFPHFEHTEIGYNYRMSNILAAIGCGQLQVLDERVKRKRKIFDYYKQALKQVPGIEFMPEASHNRSNRWLTVILITQEEFGTDREYIRLALEKENIESRPVWKPMHLQPVFNPLFAADSKKQKAYPCRIVGGEVSEDLFNRGLCLPSGTAMTNNDLNRIVDIILKCQRK